MSPKNRNFVLIMTKDNFYTLNNEDESIDRVKQLPHYCSIISERKAQEVWRAIEDHVVGQRKFLDAGYSTKMLAKDLQTNTRYISAALQLCYGNNYMHLINAHRIAYALTLLQKPKLQKKSIEEIGLMVGYVKRQTFYKAFADHYGGSPAQYRREVLGLETQRQRQARKREERLARKQAQLEAQTKPTA